MSQKYKIEFKDNELQTSKQAKSNNDMESVKGKRSKCFKISVNILWVVLILVCLYFFICSLDVMATSFQLIAGEASRRILRNSDILAFPITGLMIGVLVTILVQSSSTSTSIFITMLAADILTLKNTVYLLMGANIGTTITNTLVALIQISDREDFGKAFSGATVHDMFNWLTVIILLPLEVVSGYLQVLSKAIVESMNLKQYKEAKQDLLKAITKPLTKKIIEIDKSGLSQINSNETAKQLVKVCCEKSKNNTSLCLKKCDFIFVNLSDTWSDQAIGGLLLVLSLIVLVICLVSLVKILKTLLLNSATESAKKVINSKKLGIFKGYVAILLGIGMTILLQSSSVFTSALTPLVGTGFLSLELMFPLSLGSNIGTTVTGVLAALAADNQSIQIAMQGAMVHLFFNITGIIIWYPLPWVRAVPIYMAKKLGKAVTNHRWFAIVYILLLYVVIPGVEIGFAQINWIISVVIIGILLIIILFIAIVTCIQKKKKKVLPSVLQNWKFLPKPMRSLQPYDKVFDAMQPCCNKIFCCKKCKRKKSDEYENNAEVAGDVNNAYIASVVTANGFNDMHGPDISIHQQSNNSQVEGTTNKAYIASDNEENRIDLTNDKITKL